MLKRFNSLLRYQIISQTKTRKIYATHLPDLDLDYYCDPKNSSEIESNIRVRKGVGNINKVLDKYKQFVITPPTNDLYKIIKKDLFKELSYLPNKTHPSVKIHTEPQLLHEINEIKHFHGHTPIEFSEITRRLNLVRTDKLGNTCGHQSYYFLGELAELEEALIKYTIENLVKNNFQLVSVPDILPSVIIENCGMPINIDRTQIFSLDPVHHGPDLCLSGTAEMSLAGLLMNTVLCEKELPIKLAAVSRCYRAETSQLKEERGIYRVHQFTKVEMFVVSNNYQSDDMLEYLRTTQEALFKPLDFNMRVLDMPPHELGAPAYRKYDIEAWMPGRKNYGEISSCSNCTDYQSRRLNIRYNNNGQIYYAHTLNGTACAIPRMLITIVENHQNQKGKIDVPKVLQPYMNGKKYIARNSSVPDLKLMKAKNR